MLHIVKVVLLHKMYDLEFNFCWRSPHCCPTRYMWIKNCA